MWMGCSSSTQSPDPAGRKQTELKCILFTAAILPFTVCFLRHQKRFQFLYQTLHLGGVLIKQSPSGTINVSLSSFLRFLLRDTFCHPKLLPSKVSHGFPQHLWHKPRQGGPGGEPLAVSLNKSRRTAMPRVGVAS